MRGSGLLFGQRSKQLIGQYREILEYPDLGIGKSVYLDENIGSWYPVKGEVYHAFKDDQAKISTTHLTIKIAKAYKIDDKDYPDLARLFPKSEYTVTVEKFYPKIAIRKSRAVLVCSADHQIDFRFDFDDPMIEWFASKGRFITRAKLRTTPQDLQAEKFKEFSGKVSGKDPRDFPKELQQGADMFDVTDLGRCFMVEGDQLKAIKKVAFPNATKLEIRIAPKLMRTLIVNGKPRLVADGTEEILGQAVFQEGIFQGIISKQALLAIGIKTINSWDQEVPCTSQDISWP